MVIPHILSDALAVSFDKSVGHDYIEDAEDRFKFYHTKEIFRVDVELTPTQILGYFTTVANL